MTTNALHTIVELSKKNMHLFILAIYAYVLFQIEDTDYITMILLTVAACLSICYLKKKSSVVEGASGSVVEEAGDKPTAKQPTAKQPKVSDKSKANATPKTVKEGFENSPGPTQQKPDMMGPYDGLCLQTGNKENWMKTPDETALIPNDALFTYLSSQGPTKPVFTDNSVLDGPPIDGQPDSPKKMFMLANNRSSPNCCPSTFSTSTGCICTTNNQRDFIASRGGATLPEGSKDSKESKVDLQDI